MSTVQTSRKPSVALIAGPTASGKSALAIQLAERLEAAGRRAVVLNADSAQVYADLLVLSARPCGDDMERIQHRLYGVWDGATACSAADWAAAARREIAALHAVDAVPILVGGSGLYLRTLFDGIAPVPAIEPSIRSAVRGMPLPDARIALEREDAAAAARIAPADAARTMRALEVVRSTGSTLAEWQAHRHGGIGDLVNLAAAVLVPDRLRIYERCDRRLEAMFDGGAREEVEALLARKFDADLPVMRAIGVREIGAWIEGQILREEALLRCKIATRRYAKRQYTWFRHQTPPSWRRYGAKSCPKDVLSELFFQTGA